MFRISNSNKNIQYYTIILEKDQVRENKDDSPHVIVKPKPKIPAAFGRQYENFIYDRETNSWKSVMTYY